MQLNVEFQIVVYIRCTVYDVTMRTRSRTPCRSQFTAAAKCDFKPCTAFLRFGAPPPLGRLGTTYDVHLGLIGKSVVDFPLVLNELFSLGVTVEALRAKIDRKPAISLQRGHFDLKFQVEVDVPHQ